ncbi:chromate efflux transporter [Paracoccaceae bacterium]|nr:chromate efflux transporter [Paracoccaceae bacterium]
MKHSEFSDFLKVYGKIGLMSFGGPAGQIALMHRVIVQEKKWLNEKEYVNALSFCMLLPGPEAMQLATYSGWRLLGVRGGLISGLLFVLPGAGVVLGLAIIYALYGSIPTLSALFLGIKAAVLMIVLEALNKVARKSLKTKASWVIAGLSFVALFFLNLPFPLIMLFAALFGCINPSEIKMQKQQSELSVTISQTFKTAALWLVLWFLPLGLIAGLGGQTVLVQLWVFFSKLAMVTFGGAYSVLAYVAQDAVNAKGWLSPREMMDGLGLAETTPGPLILVTEFVGFLAAARVDGSFHFGLGLLGAAVTLWATFVPCFLWIFVGAPYIEWISSKPRLTTALTSISAAVVGVILNLSLWFSLHVLFGKVVQTYYGPFNLWIPAVASVDIPALGLSIIAAIILLGLKKSVFLTLVICAVLGFAVNCLF